MLMSDREPIIYSFAASEELSFAGQRRLIAYAAKLGLGPLFELPITSADEALEDHYRETYPPTSPEAYLGKEHFWRLGEAIGLDKKVSGGIFNALAYPLREKTASWQADEIIEPDELGLIVVSREVAEMPKMPRSDILGDSSANRDLHRKSRHGNKLPFKDTVIQVGSILELVKRPDSIKTVKGLTGDRAQHFALFAFRLERLIEAPASKA